MGSKDECLVLSTELKRQFGHCKEIRVLTFRAKALRQSDSRNCGLYEDGYKALKPVVTVVMLATIDG